MLSDHPHIDWDKLITILEKPVSERQALIAALPREEQELVAQLQQLQQDELLTGALQIDTAKAWKTTMDKAGDERTVAPVQRISLKRWIAAACLLIMAGVAWLVWKQTSVSSPHYQTVAEGLANHTPAGKVQLVTADGNAVEVDAAKQVTEKDGTVIHLHQGQVAYNNAPATQQAEGLLMNTLIIPRGYMFTLTLSDGSKVWLNADSRIHFPVHFGKTERKVEVEGQAYFEVVHNEKWPFIVNVRGSEVKVLGTSFDIKAYDKNIYTTLVTGSVQFSAAAGQSVKLSPSQQAICNSNGATSTRKVITEDIIAWKDDDLVMIKMSLAGLAEILERRYDVQVSFSDEKLKDVQYNGALHLTGNVVDILNNLEQTGNIHFAVKDKKILILPADMK